MEVDRLGTAQWADSSETAKRFRHQQGAIWLGRTVPDQEAIGVQDDRHICLVAGTRSGKGTTSIIPNLFLWPGSALVVDPTGDNASITAARRGQGDANCEGLGQRVHVLDPYRVSTVDEKYRASFNPLDLLDPSDSSVVRDAGRIAESLIPNSPEDPSWAQNGARRFLTGLILHVLTWPPFEGHRNLVTVRKLVERGDTFTQAEMAKDGQEAPADFWLRAGLKRNHLFDGKISAVGEELERVSRNAPEQWAGTHDVALSATNFIDNPDMRDCLSSSSFDLRGLKTAPEGMSVYLTIPSKDKLEDFRWLRLLVSIAMTEMESIPGKPATGSPVLMVLDEFAGLQKMDRIESGIAEIAKIAKYGVKLFIVLQNLPQLKQVYGDSWETFLSGCGTKIFFGVDDQFTRQYVSDLIGQTQVEIIEEGSSQDSSQGTSTTLSRGESNNWSTSEGRSQSDTYDRIPLLRDTAGLLRKLTGRVSASDSHESSSSRGGAHESSASQTTQYGESIGRQQNRRVHQRPLVSPDEVGKYFRRLEPAEASLLHPGLAIALLSSSTDPVLLRRVEYFCDPLFERCFAPPIGYELSAVVDPVPLNVTRTPFGDWRDNGDGTYTDIANRLQWMTGAVGMEWNGDEWSGQPEAFEWHEASSRYGRGTPLTWASINDPKLAAKEGWKLDRDLLATKSRELMLRSIDRDSRTGLRSREGFRSSSGWRLPWFHELYSLRMRISGVEGPIWVGREEFLTKMLGWMYEAGCYYWCANPEDSKVRIARFGKLRGKEITRVRRFNIYSGGFEELGGSLLSYHSPEHGLRAYALLVRDL